MLRLVLWLILKRQFDRFFLLNKLSKLSLGNLTKYGSLFTYLPATVTVNGLENEMSDYCRFQGRKWGVGRKQGKPRDPKGREGLPLLETPPIFDRENGNNREFHFINRLT